jgi:uncharacterized membrane protein YfcA
MEWLAVLAMGWILGVIGGGGGILTVPILVGLFGMTATAASGSSLFVVGIASSVGAAQGLIRKESEWRTALALAIPSMIGALSARLWLVPSIPSTLLGFPRDEWFLVIFAVLMVIIGIRMLRPTMPDQRENTHPLKVAGLGLAIGLISGVLGAGGGFLILPVLVALLKVPITRAVPTSLLVISLQSLVGFAGELSRPVDWRLLGSIAGVAILGLVIGLAVRKFVPKQGLTVGFAVLVFLVAGWMVAKVFMNHF